jgi:tRNA-binding EMAP/Myf-like protein
MTLSTHKCEVVQVHPKPHPNADRLEIVELFDGGYTCCAVKGQFKDGDLAAYIPPDSLVETVRPEFAFLAKDGKTTHRVRAVKLRGVQSYGLLMAAPPGAKLGDDAAEYYDVRHYDPEEAIAGPKQPPRKRGFWRSVRTVYWRFLNLFRKRKINLEAGGDDESAPEQLKMVSKYDIDSMRRYKHVFQPGEPVMVTCKLDGANSRYVWLDGRLWCGSRNQWKRQTEADMWWRTAAKYPQIEAFCKAHPGSILYGEVYGQVQSLKYGTKPGEVLFAAFDILQADGRFMDACEFRLTCEGAQIPLVPLLSANMPFDFEAVCALAEGPSLVPGAGHFREGCVCRPLVERWNQSVGRVALKVVSAQYLAKSE